MRFIDTNIFVYAYDNEDPTKTAISHTLLEGALISGAYAISTQVVGEFCNACLSKARIGLMPEQINDILDEVMLPLLAHRPDGDFYRRATALYGRYSLNFYDACIVQAAIDLGCDTLYTEDMQNGANYGGVRVVNPFV